MHIGVLTHNYPRFPGDFSGTFVEALCQEFVHQQQQVTVWAPYDSAYTRPLDNGVQATAGVRLRLYRYVWPDALHRLGYMRTMQADLALRLEAYALSPLLFAAGINTVLREARRSYLYFVALPDGSGRHVFATTYEEHLENVARNPPRTPC